MKRAKKKKRKKSKFPHFLTIAGSQSTISDGIITDAGFDSIDYELALSYFSSEEIIYWWESIIDFSELEDDEFEAWENILPSNFYSLQTQDKLTIFQEIINQFEFIPKKVSVATARAVFNSEYQWVKIISIIDKYEVETYIDSYEQQAIQLGLKMKQELADEDLLIINDNKHAVASMSGYPVYMWDWIDDLKENKSDIVWAPRKTVKIADKLTVAEATKIFAPDDDLDSVEYEYPDHENLGGHSFFSIHLTTTFLARTEPYCQKYPQNNLK